jgi:bacterioferritin-associated ferredoxin
VVLEPTSKSLPQAQYHVYEPFRVNIAPASGSKCARCWNFMPDTADYGIWQNVCGRCREALKEMGIAPPLQQEAAQ